MPIEIRELIIKAYISPNTQNGEKNPLEKAYSKKELIKLKEELKEECLKQMKEYLKDQKER